MIRLLYDPAEYRSFIDTIARDERFSTPFFTAEKGEKAPEKKDHAVWGCYKKNGLIGVFCFLILPEEQYLESMFLFARKEEAYRELIDHLKAQYPGFEAWFVMNPKNDVLRNLLSKARAFFFAEQKYMSYQGEAKDNIPSVIPYSDLYKNAYISLHTRDAYWTGEKMLDALDRFSVFLYTEADDLLGYVDVSRGEGTNEIFDLLVRPEDRNRGIGRLLMEKAIHENIGHELILTVDSDNTPAFHLYESLGFREVPQNRSLTVRYSL